LGKSGDEDFGVEGFTGPETEFAEEG